MRREVHDPQLLPAVLSVLKVRGVVIMPCDTIYGFVGIAPETEGMIRELKGREDKSFLLLIPSVSWLRRFTRMKLPESLKPFWPGPLTLIFPAREKTQTVALRLPADPFLLKLMRTLKRPLFSTSVNRSGEQALWRIEEIAAAFEDRVALIVDAGDLPDRTPSTILDLTARPFRVLRQGALRLPDSALS